MTSQSRDCIAGLSTLIDITQESYDRQCPVRCKIQSHKSKKKPWITHEIVSNIKKKRAYYILYLQNKLSKRFYTQFRNFVTNQIRNSKRHFFKAKFDQYKRDAKNTWKVVSSILSSARPSGRGSIREIIIGGEVIRGDENLAECLNNFFADVGSNVAGQILPGSRDHASFIKGDFAESFFYKPNDSANRIFNHKLSKKQSFKYQYSAHQSFEIHISSDIGSSLCYYK